MLYQMNHIYSATPKSQPYINRSLNAYNLSKLFDNPGISFKILEKLGFQRHNNRLILKHESTHLNNNYYKSCNNKQQNENSNDDSKDDSQDDDIDASIAELLDALPTKKLEKYAKAIRKFVKKNDFEALKQFLQKKSIPLYAKLHKHFVIRIKRDISATLKKVRDSLDILVADHDDKDIHKNDTIVKWLYKWDLPKPVAHSLMEMMIECNFDLTKKT